MRFNDKRTCLEFIRDGEIKTEILINKPSWDLGRRELMKHDIIDSFKVALPYCRFGDKIQYITLPFHNAFERSKIKIAEIIEKEELKDHGTFILQSDKDITKTIFYWINKEKNSNAFEAIFFSFARGLGMTAVDFCVQYKRVSEKEEDGVDVNYFVGGYYDKYNLSYKNVTSEWIAMIGFLKYCEIETRVLAPKEKYRKDGVRYFNEEKFKIEVLDCTWFTNLVVSGAFSVSGHLRWQPTKVNGEWTKKLIWINEFEKHGYHRKAKTFKQ